MTDTSQNTTHDSNRGDKRGREVRSMNEDGPDDSPYGTLVKHDQSETKHDNKGRVVVQRAWEGGR
jgi:hypothetical protein